jgi:threonine aldolase
MVGGGMRQVGVLAAAGVVALEQMLDRMQEDHDNARLLAEGIAEIRGLGLDPETVQTNIVFFDFASERMTAQQFCNSLNKAGVLMLALGSGRVRAVTHYGVERGDVEYALHVMRQVMTG